MRIAGMVEAVGWDHTVEEEKGRRVMESLREVFADGAIQVRHFSLVVDERVENGGRGLRWTKIETN